MNSSPRPLSVLLLLALSGAVVPLAWAQSEGGEHGRPSESRFGESGAERGQREWRAVPPRAHRSSSLSEAVRRVQRQTGGQVLGAERVQFDGRDINRIKILDDRGRVRYLDDDPQRRQSSRDAARAGRARGDNPHKP